MNKYHNNHNENNQYNGYKCYQLGHYTEALTHYLGVIRTEPQGLQKYLLMQIVAVLNIHLCNYNEAYSILLKIENKLNRTHSHSYQEIYLLLKIYCSMMLIELINCDTQKLHQHLKQIIDILISVQQQHQQLANYMFINVIKVFYGVQSFQYIHHTSEYHLEQISFSNNGLIYSTLSLLRQLVSDNLDSCFRLEYRAFEIYKSKSDYILMAVSCRHLIDLTSKMHLQNIQVYHELMKQILNTPQLRGVSSETLFRKYEEKIILATQMTTVLKQYEQEYGQVKIQNQINWPYRAVIVKLRQEILRETNNKNKQQMQQVLQAIKNQPLQLQFVKNHEFIVEAIVQYEKIIQNMIEVLQMHNIRYALKKIFNLSKELEVKIELQHNKQYKELNNINLKSSDTNKNNINQIINYKTLFNESPIQLFKKQEMQQVEEENQNDHQNHEIRYSTMQCQHSNIPYLQSSNIYRCSNQQTVYQHCSSQIKGHNKKKLLRNNYNTIMNQNYGKNQPNVSFKSVSPKLQKVSLIQNSKVYSKSKSKIVTIQDIQSQKNQNTKMILQSKLRQQQQNFSKYQEKCDNDHIQEDLFKIQNINQNQSNKHCSDNNDEEIEIIVKQGRPKVQSSFPKVELSSKILDLTILSKRNQEQNQSSFQRNQLKIKKIHTNQFSKNNSTINIRVSEQHNAYGDRSQKSMLKSNLQQKNYKAIKLCQCGQYLDKKHLSSDGGQQKFMQLTKDYRQIRWAKNEQKINSGNSHSYQLSQIKGIVYGKVTDTMMKSCNRSLEPWKCFSLILKKRTLDLYCIEEKDIEFWLPGLTFSMMKFSLKIQGSKIGSKIKNSSKNNHNNNDHQNHHNNLFVYSQGRVLWKRMLLKLQTKYLFTINSSKIKRKYHNCNAYAIILYGYKHKNLNY